MLNENSRTTPIAYDTWIDQKILRGPIDEVENTLRFSFDADRLAELCKICEEDSRRRLRLISARRDQIRGS